MATASRSRRTSLPVLRFIELYVEATWNLEVGDQAVSVVRDIIDELDPPRAQVPNGRVNIVAVKGDVGRTGRDLLAIGGVHAKVGLRRVEDQPSAADVGTLQAELDTQECSQLLRLR